jgi:hypothetical protein
MEFSDDSLKTWNYETDSSKEIFCGNYRVAANVAETIEANLSNTDIVIGQLCPEKVRVRFAKHMNIETDISMEQSSTRFLGVEYKCGNPTPYTITIHVPKSHYYVGNQLLSKAYILRYLEHMSIFVNWAFDDTYSVRMIDEYSNIFSLNSNQYIELKRDGYIIKDIESAESSSSDNSTVPAESSSSDNSTVPRSDSDESIVHILSQQEETKTYLESDPPSYSK